jgi:serine/threonine-protein kinase
MGQVFRASDIALGLSAAIKVPALNILRDPMGADRFLKEARTAARLGPHLHIVLIKACLRDPELRIALGSGLSGIPLPFFVMEYLGGGDLAELVARGPLDLHTVSRIFADLCSALQYSHSYTYRDGNQTVRGVVHRDLKPENVCFDETGRLVVVDFGLARVLGELSLTRGMSGTPTHMAPEQWRGGEIDNRTDIYALGVILFQLVTGGLPFSGSHEQVMAGHLLHPPPDPRGLRHDVPDGVADAILRSMAKEPGSRFQRVDDFARAVSEGFSARQRAKTDRVTPPPPTPPPGQGPAPASPARACAHCQQMVTPEWVGGVCYCSNCGSALGPPAASSSGEPHVANNHQACPACGSSSRTVVAEVPYCAECGARLAETESRKAPAVVSSRQEMDASNYQSGDPCPRCTVRGAPDIVGGQKYCSNCGAPWQA